MNRPKSSQSGPPRPRTSRTTLIAWAFYDWANNGFATVILTFVFSAYFTRRVAPDSVSGSAVWGNMVGLYAFSGKAPPSRAPSSWAG